MIEQCKSDVVTALLSTSVIFRHFIPCYIFKYTHGNRIQQIWILSVDKNVFSHASNSF